MALADKIPFLQRINFDDVYNTFLGLDKKQQIMASIAVACALIALTLAPVSCISSQLGEKREEYESHLDKASRFFGVLSEYQKLQSGFEKIQESFLSMGSDSLSTVIYNIAGEIGIQKSKVELKSVNLASGENLQEVGKEVRMRAVPLDELMRFMEKLDAFETIPLTIKKLTIKADQNDKKVMHQVSFTVSTIKPSK